MSLLTVDCPLIDPDICGAVLRLREQQSADYASDIIEASFPKGLDCEAFTMTALAEAAEKTADLSDREHVTPWLMRMPHLKRVNFHSGDVALARLRWTLDYPEDLAFIRAVIAAMPPGFPSRMGDILAVIERNPAIVDLNATRNPSIDDASA